MAFKTTKNRTHLRLVREVEAIGGNVLASGACAAGGLSGGTLANDAAMLLLLLYSKQSSRVRACVCWQWVAGAAQQLRHGGSWHAATGQQQHGAGERQLGAAAAAWSWALSSHAAAVVSVAWLGESTVFVPSIQKCCWGHELGSSGG